jgi:mannose-6-phosphate isomerase-like protein (cupin superfamily)
MIKYLQLPLMFDVQLLQAAVQKLNQESWKLHFQVKHYDGNWSAIPLRSIGGDANNTLISPNENDEYKDTVFLQQSPYFQTILNQIKCPLLSVRLLKLGAGTHIHEHKDGGLCIEEGLLRLHIPIISNKQIEFLLDGEQLFLEEGTCWYCNFNLPHALHNKSSIDRIHLVIDAKVNDWVLEQFCSPLVKHRKEAVDAPKHSNEELQQIIYHLKKQNTAASISLAKEMAAQLK